MYALMYALWHLLPILPSDFFNYICVKKDLHNRSNQHKIIKDLYLYSKRNTLLMFDHSNESFLIVKKDNTNHNLSSDIVDSVV